MHKKQLTTSAGIPFGDNQNSPLPVHDWQLSLPRRPCPVLRIIRSNPRRRDTAIPIEPESGRPARRGRASGLAKGIVARSRKANSCH